MTRHVLAAALLILAACGPERVPLVCSAEAGVTLSCDNAGNPWPSCYGAPACPSPLVTGGCGVASGLVPECVWDDFFMRSVAMCTDPSGASSGRLMQCVPPAAP